MGREVRETFYMGAVKETSFSISKNTFCDACESFLFDIILVYRFYTEANDVQATSVQG